MTDKPTWEDELDKVLIRNGASTRDCFNDLHAFIRTTISQEVSAALDEARVEKKVEDSGTASYIKDGGFNDAIDAFESKKAEIKKKYSV